VSHAVTSDAVIDIFGAVGIKAPDVSILSDEFLDDVRDMAHKNLALELLRKLLNDEIKAKARKNKVQARSFAQMLDSAIRRYQNRTIDAAEIIEELIDLAKDMREATQRGEQMGLSDEELAFYDAQCACLLSGYCENTAIRPICRTRLPKRCLNKPKYWRRSGPFPHNDLKPPLSRSS